MIDAIPAVNMTSIAEKVACAKRGGPNFLETIRPDPETFFCPRNTVPCSYYTTINDTICVKEYERDYECPIIDMFVVHEDLIPYLRANGFELTEEGFVQEGGYATHIAFSRVTTRTDSRQEPIMSTVINTVQPCYGPEKETIVLSEAYINEL